MRKKRDNTITYIMWITFMIEAVMTLINLANSGVYYHIIVFLQLVLSAFVILDFSFASIASIMIAINILLWGQYFIVTDIARWGLDFLLISSAFIVIALIISVIGAVFSRNKNHIAFMLVCVNELYKALRSFEPVVFNVFFFKVNFNTVISFVAGLARVMFALLWLYSWFCSINKAKKEEE